jgi:hypothetical protein
MEIFYRNINKNTSSFDGSKQEKQAKYNFACSKRYAAIFFFATDYAIRHPHPRRASPK